MQSAQGTMGKNTQCHAVHNHETESDLIRVGGGGGGSSGKQILYRNAPQEAAALVLFFLEIAKSAGVMN